MGLLNMPSAAFSSSCYPLSRLVSVSDTETPYPTRAAEMFVPFLATKP